MAQMRFGAVVLAVCLAALIQTSFAATSHTVGGSTGWTIPTSNSLYSSWAASQTFKVGDTLVFNFQTGTHTVAEVSKSAYDKCTITNPISTASTGPASITLSTAGTHYYICTIPGHCSASQKLAITAAASASTAPTAAPATSPAASTPSSSPSPAPSTSPAASPATTPAASPATSPVASPASSPATSPTASSPSSGSAPTTSIATSPEASTVPSAMSPSSGNTAPAPSSATVAGAGFLIPVIMVATAFLV